MRILPKQRAGGMAGADSESKGEIVTPLVDDDETGAEQQSKFSAGAHPPVSKIQAVRLPLHQPEKLYDISIANGFITSIEDHDFAPEGIAAPRGAIYAMGGLCYPSFCHAHVHLDKCFLLTDPKFSDLVMVNGDFAEAMELTGQAKSRFETDDLLRRGRRLMDESIRCGVTHMRAFVEVDEVVGMKCVNAALTLKSEYRAVCEIQVCVFAQLALFAGEDGGETRRRLMEQAVEKKGVDVVGSTPYVEENRDKLQQNIAWTVNIALRTKKHLDFHLDYNLDHATEPAVWDLLRELKERNWLGRSEPSQKITLGHCTRLTLFTRSEWTRLKQDIGNLPISFVGLPTSDLFMMGRPESGTAGSERPRGTLQILSMIADYDLNCAMAINNIGNAFTPQGSCNLLNLANFGIPIYQAATKKLVEMILVSRCSVKINTTYRTLTRRL